jgi:ABC-type bacteriocin/lantibiotic exporter with double-glycine peptidase domain
MSFPIYKQYGSMLCGITCLQIICKYYVVYLNVDYLQQLCQEGKTFNIADLGKGLVKYNFEEFNKHWICTQSGGEEQGMAIFLEPKPAFYERKIDEQPTEERSFKSILQLFRCLLSRKKLIVVVLI